MIKIFLINYKLYEVSFGNASDDSLPKNYYRITYLFKYLSDDALNYAFTRMLNGGYLNVMIGVCISDKKSPLYSYILSRHSEMKAENKVKLLPCIREIHFDTDKDCESFFDSIVERFGYFPLALYSDKAPKLKDCNINVNRDKYLEDCKNLLLYGEKPIDNLYTYGSGYMRGDISRGEQKFILEALIFDSENFNFDLVTSPDASYHRDLVYNCFGDDILCGGYLKKSESLATIFVFGSSSEFGKIPPRLYPVIEDILRRQYPGYDVEFGNPDYRW